MPLLFITSDEGAIEDERMISMKEALAEEKTAFPAISPGYWATGLKVRSGISPTVKSLDHWTVEIAIPGKDGKPQPVTLTTDHSVTVATN